MTETVERDAFRARVRTWLTANAPDPDELPNEQSSEALEAARRFAASLTEAGLVGLSYPTAYGGQGWGPAEERIFAEEASRFSLPIHVFGIGLGMCAPTILRLGTPAQRKRYLRPLLEGREIWCQMFSEPGAGSDVAGVETRAVADGDGFILTGHKVWSTGAQHCDYGIVLARTDPDAAKHAGLTMFVVDLTLPWITVTPLRDMTGIPHFNEVFFDDVRLAGDSVLGEIGGGWAAARLMLQHERLAVSGGLGSEGHQDGPMSFRALRGYAEEYGVTGDPSVQSELVDLYLLEHSIDLFNSQLSASAAAGVDPGARGSVGKLLQARRELASAVLAARIIGPTAVAHDGTWDDLTAEILSSPSLAIGGGTNEIQLSIIAEHILGLPREPSSDTRVSFRELKQRQKEETR